MTVGEKIRKYRLKLKISQKLLASWCNISEPAIRNYELGNRQPSDKNIKIIAEALGVSPFAISNPNLDNTEGIMHALFYLEAHYGLLAYREKQDPDDPNRGWNLYNNLRFDCEKSGSNRNLDDSLEIWISTKEKLASGEITKEYYNDWISSYPKLYAKECHEELRDLRKKKSNKKDNK
jgi:transcriptional regulator with XRE-family HTH domain